MSSALAEASRAARREHVPVVAMVGAGQLARMTHQAAIALGVELRVLAGRPDDSAVRAGATYSIGSPSELADLTALAEGADVVTFDHEHIPPDTLVTLEQNGVRLAPAPAAKLYAQDKLHARRELARRGFPVPPFEFARTLVEVERFADQHGWPVVGKVPRGGYDGRGVFVLADRSDAERALGGGPDGLVLEPLLDITRELAVIVARSTAGERAVYPVVETVQQEAMCREIQAAAAAAAPVGAERAAEAEALAMRLAEEIEATGVVAVELFETREGLLVNELALRPHNSGHYTIEGCVTSQFEQHLRAVLGWPLGSTELVAPAVVTVNVVGREGAGDPAARLPDALAVRGAHVHLYGKSYAPGRKLGHVTVCGADREDVTARAREAAALLEGAAS